MNREELNAKVELWFKEHRNEMVEDLKTLVRCPSVSNPASDVKPFGPGCRQAVDTMMELAEKHGFTMENYDYHVLRIGGEQKNWENTVGFWGHLDVVPAGFDWIYDPFDPVEEDGFLIGRGVMDNKSAVIGVLYMLRCLRELGLELKHDYCIFAGCDEERGMEDISYFRSHYTDMPKINIITDCMFPVCYGEKGILEARLVADDTFSTAVLGLTGGSASNAVPSVAVLTLARTAELEAALTAAPLPENIQISYETDAITIQGKGIAMHSAFPEEGKPNAIHELAAFAATISALPEHDRTIFETIAECSTGFYGDCIGIDYQDEVSGRLTSVATTLRLDERKASVGLNIRYSISADPQDLLQKLDSYSASQRFHVDPERISEPSYFPKEHPLVDTLTGIFNDVTGLGLESYVLPGGTYARKLPNAFGYGPEIPITQEESELRMKKFGVGHGDAHGPDECVYIDQILTQMRIYTLCVAEMNNISL